MKNRRPAERFRRNGVIYGQFLKELVGAARIWQFCRSPDGGGDPSARRARSGNAA
jgi:hypothetical protein